MQPPSTIRSSSVSDQPDQIDIEVGLALRRLRKTRALSQSDLGAAIGITFQQIQKYERGTNRVSCSMLVKMARVLKVRTQDILPQEDAPEVPGFVHSYATVRGTEELVNVYCMLPSKLRHGLLQFARVMQAELSRIKESPDLDVSQV